MAYKATPIRSEERLIKLPALTLISDVLDLVGDKARLTEYMKDIKAAVVRNEELVGQFISKKEIEKQKGAIEKEREAVEGLLGQAKAKYANAEVDAERLGESAEQQLSKAGDRAAEDLRKVAVKMDAAEEAKKDANAYARENEAMRNTLTGQLKEIDTKMKAADSAQEAAKKAKGDADDRLARVKAAGE